MTYPVDPTSLIPLPQSELTALIAEVDPYDLAAVKALLARVYLFAEILSDESLDELCRQGRGHEALKALAPNLTSDTELRRLKGCFEMPISKIWENPDLESRAWDIASNPIFGTDQERCDLIESVADAGIIGALVQAKLQPPMTIRRILPSWYRPRIRVRSVRDRLPNLFETFGEDWRMPTTPKQARCKQNTVCDHTSID